MASPSSAGMSRVCVRSYTTPTIAKNSAVIIPCENICNTAPLNPSGCSVAIPITTYPIWLTLEYPMTYFKSDCPIAEIAPYITFTVPSPTSAGIQNSAPSGKMCIPMRIMPNAPNFISTPA